ncbi:hypothetical protein MSG34_03235 [Vibrio sp. 1CM2L]|uniref:helix-turn-helix transcriptional regulator n=1 Tax=Vibrio TaxID=662 RepID=UPI000631713A|nr:MULTISPECIES: hypothetical protein [Vibrio]MCK8075156.1 hypothetical protein [Vibrio sp. 1CM2L]CDT13590.1 hypothetical protein VCR1J2_200550 [Vibrio coralliirubri]CDT14988.1 hypothetical protein VCR6J2_230369 [Vibrio coralliirubri]CDT53259.1 hypothetical protein VCR29J2_360309 [Vibrio coralliirubri]CDT74549.1 hypothetical protein VCR8J2_190192 [Vibrio coralliirubri]
MAWTDEQRQIVNTNSQLMDLDELAELTGKSRRTIYQYLYRNSIEFKQKIGGRSKRYSDKVVEEIRSMAREGKKLHDISEVTGVSKGYISCLVRGLDRKVKTNKAKVEQVGLKQCCANLLNSVFKD